MHKNFVEQGKPIGGEKYTYLTVFFAHFRETIKNYIFCIKLTS